MGTILKTKPLYPLYPFSQSGWEYLLGEEGEKWEGLWALFVDADSIIIIIIIFFFGKFWLKFK